MILHIDSPNFFFRKAENDNGISDNNFPSNTTLIIKNPITATCSGSFRVVLMMHTIV